MKDKVIHEIFIYSDESGTFDYIHNEYFLFGGLILFSKNEVDIWQRKYAHAENCIRGSNSNKELKGSNISNSKKGKLFRSLNNVYKFCVVIKQNQVNKEVFSHKKHKQRYLDFAYKVVIKKCLEELVNKNYILARQIRFIFVHADDHSTATDGKYELREGLLNEFKHGTFNLTYEKHFKPLFPALFDVKVRFCDSKNTRLVRAADIICNHCYYYVNLNKGDLGEERNMFVYYLPGNYIGHDGLEYFKEDVKEDKKLDINNESI